MKHNKMQYKEFKLHEKSNHIKTVKGSGSMYKRYRTTFKKAQLRKLQAEFAKTSFLTNNDRERISKQLCLDGYTIKVWFQNQRQKNRKKGTKPTAGGFSADRYCAPESPQPTDDDYIQSEVDEDNMDECSSKKLPLEQPQLDRGEEIRCQTPEPRVQTENRLTEEPTCSQLVKSRGDCQNQPPPEQGYQPPQHVVYPLGMFLWGQGVYTQQQLFYTPNVQQPWYQQPWYQQQQIHQHHVQAYNFQHQFYGGPMAEFRYQFNPYGHNQQQHSDFSQQQIPWQYFQLQYIPQQTTQEQYATSRDDQKLDTAKIIQSTIHCMS